jgi:large subunit ribosomal protein L23
MNLLNADNQERLYHVIIGTHVTEKAMSESDSNVHVFKVATNATKSEIKSAIKELFEVDVKSVRTSVVKGKTKSFGRRTGKRKDWKKAYVRLSEGQVINMEAEG